MPAPVSITPSSAPASPVSPPLGASAFGILGTGGGLFGHILNLDGISPSTSETQNNLLLSGNNGFTLSSAMLVLPQELSSLSNEDLQKFLAQFVDRDNGGLNNQVLKSLTPGIPTTELFSNIVANNPVEPNAHFLIDNNHPLLVASGLTPSTMEEFRTAIKTVAHDVALNKKNPEELIDKNGDPSDTPAAMMMVMFLSVPSTTAPPDLKDFEFDPSTFSSLTKIVQPKSDGTNLFGGEIDLNSENNPLLALEKSQGVGSGFKGSLASLKDHTDGAEKSANDIGDIKGQLTQSSPLNAQLLGAPLSHFNESSLLMANGSLLGSHNLSPNTNPLFTSSNVVGSHPATHLIAMMIEKAASGSDKAKQELSVQLDPPELGRMQIHLSMEKGEAMKVHLVADTQETLNLLQRDSHALKSALDNAGIQMDNSSLSFDLSSGNQSFNQLLGGSQQDNQSGRNLHYALGADGSIIQDDQIQSIETRMNFIQDYRTGNIHYSLLV